MRIKDNIEISQLCDFGFEKINKEEEQEDGQYVISNFEYKYEIGHSRRGQVYYILISEHRIISLYASEPDGSGGAVRFPEVIIKLMDLGWLELELVK